MFLLDTNVVSELRKAAKANPRVRRWASRIAPTELYLSAISVLEFEIGILRVERRDPSQGAILRAWLEDRVLTAFEDRIVPIDTAVARRCARLHVPNPHSDRDALIAATAMVHGMTVVTRNVADFHSTGVAHLNPWEA
ncbi:MAG: type II toxin-antitoxin system VapC family toxin [Acidobacteriaceae bacterium]